MLDENLFRSEELAVFHLRDLYRRYGYLPYRMSKFEEYELYVRNKDFLVSDRVITFNDTNGKLLALKPDVTLSIIRGGEDTPGTKQKVYYNENVYRVSERTHRFKEIMQAGLECIGDTDLYDVYEVISLAAESLAQISGDFALEISHLGVISAALTRACPDEGFRERALACIAEKNAHDLQRLCREYGVDAQAAQTLMVFITAYGVRHQVLDALRAVCPAEEISELEMLSALLDAAPHSEHIVFDFSVVNSMNYYNGFVFKGYLDGICDGVLAGGQYDRMMGKLGRRSGAIGFAMYLDLLEQLRQERADYDVDVLLLYDAVAGSAAVAQTVRKLVAAGKTVSAQKAVPDKLRWRETVDLRKEGR